MGDVAEECPPAQHPARYIACNGRLDAGHSANGSELPSTDSGGYRLTVLSNSTDSSSGSSNSEMLSKSFLAQHRSSDRLRLALLFCKGLTSGRPLAGDSAPTEISIVLIQL